MWQINKTTKKCLSCAKALGVNEDFFSALYYCDPAVVRPTGSSAEKGRPGQTDSDAQQLNRHDYCANCWERRMASGEESPFSFWQTKYTKAPEPPKTPRQVLISFFDNLFTEPQATETLPTEEAPAATTGIEIQSIEAPAPAANPESSAETEIVPVTQTGEAKLKAQAKYLFTLILMRKKILKLRQTVREGNKRILVLERSVDNKSYQVPEVDISESELATLRDQFSGLFEFRI